MRPREPFVFFVDRSLGSLKVAAALRNTGAEVRAHDEIFAQDTPDETWLRDVGARGWVILTKDKRIQKRPSEFVALFDANTAVFVLSAGTMTAEAMGVTFVAAFPAMCALVAGQETPFIARIQQSGAVAVFFDALGVEKRAAAKRAKIR